MQIQSLTSIRTEDFPDQQNWIGRLLLPLNQFLLSVTTAVNGNLTFGDNIPCQTQTLAFTYGAESDYPKSFVWTLPAKPVEFRVCSATENDTPICVVFSWKLVNKQVQIQSIFKVTVDGVSALTTGSRYNIVLRGQP